MIGQVETPGVEMVPNRDEATRSTDPARILVMLLAASTVVPASVYLDYAATLPSFDSFVLVASGSFVLLASVVGLLSLRFRSELFVVAAALVWIVFSIYGRVFSQIGSGVLRFVILLLLFGFVALLLRMFRAKIISWFLIASVMSLVATTVQLAMVPSASTGLELFLPVAPIEPQGDLSYYDELQTASIHPLST